MKEQSLGNEVSVSDMLTLNAAQMPMAMTLLDTSDAEMERRRQSVPRNPALSMSASADCNRQTPNSFGGTGPSRRIDSRLQPASPARFQPSGRGSEHGTAAAETAALPALSAQADMNAE